MADTGPKLTKGSLDGNKESKPVNIEKDVDDSSHSSDQSDQHHNENLYSSGSSLKAKKKKGKCSWSQMTSSARAGIFNNKLSLGHGVIPLIIALLIWGSYDFYLVVDDGTLHWGTAAGVINGTFKICVLLSAIYALVLKSPVAAHLVVVGYNAFLVGIVMTMFSSVGDVMFGAIRGESIENQQYIDLSIDVSVAVLALVISFTFYFSVLGSWRLVLSSGGTGWEKKNYLRIADERERRELMMLTGQQLLQMRDDLIAGKEVKIPTGEEHEVDYTRHLTTSGKVMHRGRALSRKHQNSSVKYLKDSQQCNLVGFGAF